MTNLPPLPEPSYRKYVDCQLTEYGALCRKQALEEAANECYEISKKHWSTYKYNPGPDRYDPHFQGLADGASECEDKIRELIIK